MSSRGAVLIGCNEYDSLNSLRCPVNDVNTLYDLLIDPAVGSYTDVDRFNTGQLSFEILPKLEEKITQASASDTLLFYFSGHGKQDPMGRLYLAVKNTKETALDSTSLAIDRLISYIDRSKCSAISVILDCCYSGNVKGVFRKGSVDDKLSKVTHGRSFHIITSSTSDEVSHEKEGETNSVFTKFLVEGLQTGHADLNLDGIITTNEAFKYTHSLVKGTGLQNPTQFNLGGTGEFVLAKNKYHRPFDPHLLSASGYRKSVAVKSMIEIVNSRDDASFMVMLFQYFIEGVECVASGLTVSGNRTPNLRQTQEGFECNAFFAPRLLTKKILESKEVINGVVMVDMAIRYDDMLAIHGTVHGEPLTLHI